MKVQLLLDRLSDVKEVAPDRWMCRCPAHKDKTPSLSVRVKDGKLLVHCFVGCETTSVLEAVGLTWQDLYDEAWAARDVAGKTLKVDPFALERRILRLADQWARQGKVLSLEDAARIEEAKIRLGVK